jgi:hypothetical protein
VPPRRPEPRSRQQPEVIWRVSNRQVLGHFLAGMGIDGDLFAAVCVLIDKRGKISDAELTVELGKIGVDATRRRASSACSTYAASTSSPPRCRPTIPASHRPARADRLRRQPGHRHLIRIDLSVIRGLSYYTGTVWEVFDATGIAAARHRRRWTLRPSHGTVFGGKPTAMVGFGFGDVVITEILASAICCRRWARASMMWSIPWGQEFAVANRIAAHLRGEGRHVVVDYSERRFKHVMPGRGRWRRSACSSSAVTRSRRRLHGEDAGWREEGGEGSSGHAGSVTRTRQRVPASSVRALMRCVVPAKACSGSVAGMPGWRLPGTAMTAKPSSVVMAISGLSSKRNRT